MITDWSNNEFERFFTNSQKSKPDEEVTLSRFNNVSWPAASQSSSRPFATSQDRMRILLADAFVSVVMTCCMEHECYATVAYNQADKSCQLSMPDQVIIAMSAEGLFDLSIGSNIKLRIREDNLTFSANISHDGDQRVSKTMYNFARPETYGNDSGRILLVTRDSRENVFTVHSDGSVTRDSDSDVSPSKSPSRQCRLFAMNRDFTAHEYLHKSKRNEFEKRLNTASGSNVVSISNGRTAGLEYRLFLNPPEPTNYSKMWLQTVT